MWKQAPANNDDDSEEDEVVMNQWTSVVGGDGMLQVAEGNKLKRKWYKDL